MYRSAERREVGQWFILAAVIAMACVVTHHVTTYSLILALAACALATVLVGPRGAVSAAAQLRAFPQVRAVWLLLAAIVVASGAWFGLMATATYNYISFHVDAGFTELAGVVEHGHGNHQLFQRSTVPRYETVAAFLAPVIVGVAALAGLQRLWRAGGVPSWATGLGTFGLLYFVSLPFMVSVGGNEGARRSWGFTYLGVAVLVAPVAAALAVHAWRRAGGARVALVGLVLAAVCVIQVGNIAVGVNETYRFPGPYIYGSDTRSQTPETTAAALWFERSQGPGHRIAIDRYTGLAFFAAGHQNTVALTDTYPLWKMYLEAKPPPRELLEQVWSSGFRYLVVDKRSTRALPREGIYFEPSEPQAFIRHKPLPPEAVEKFNRAPWATKLYASDNLDVYRIDIGAASNRPVPALRGSHR
jgi:hypothetical protein